MLERAIQIASIGLRVEPRQQGIQRRRDIADDTEADRRTAAELFRPEIDLRDAGGALGVELAIGKIRPQHQQRVAVVHRIVAGGEADQPGHADAVGVLPFHVLFTPERVDHRALQLVAQRQKPIVRARAARAAQHGDAIGLVQEIGKRLELGRLRHDGRWRRKQKWRLRRRRRQSRLQRDVAGDHDHRHAALADRFADGHLERARHLPRAGDQLAIVAALLEEVLRMGFLEISGADLRRRDVGGNHQHRHARTVAVEQPVDQMEIARSAASGAHGQRSGEMRLRARPRRPPPPRDAHAATRSRLAAGSRR